jgi:hypothetical protein
MRCREPDQPPASDAVSFVLATAAMVRVAAADELVVVAPNGLYGGAYERGE